LRTGVKTGATTPMAYAERVNLAIDHVVGHLGEPLRLADVARAARLSPFHCHRVFQVLVGETLAEFVKRLRLERALVMMASAFGSCTAAVDEASTAAPSAFELRAP
jgi:AraC family transcriptional regulator